MGSTQPNLYNAFGDQRDLFLTALDYYQKCTLRERITRLEANSRPGTAIAAFFAEIVERSLDDHVQPGWMMVNSALEATPDDAELRAALFEELAQTRDFSLRYIRQRRLKPDPHLEVSPK